MNNASARGSKHSRFSPEVALDDECAHPSGQTALKSSRRPSTVWQYSPFTRRILAINVATLCVFFVTVLALKSLRDPQTEPIDSLLSTQAELVADLFGTQIIENRPFVTLDPQTISRFLGQMDLSGQRGIVVFDALARPVAQNLPDLFQMGPLFLLGERHSGIPLETDATGRDKRNAAQPDPNPAELPSVQNRMAELVALSLSGQPQSGLAQDTGVGQVFVVVHPILVDSERVGSIAMVAPDTANAAFLDKETGYILGTFLGLLVFCVIASLAMASRLEQPLTDLANAVEKGSHASSQNSQSDRISIPDLSVRSDEIGRLSGALQAMISALYDRIESNEQFAADVAHEIKNPLASLRSAAGTLRRVQKDEQRSKLIDVIEHDVRRLDRLVSDISEVSRLDSELVKQEDKPFDLLNTIRNLCAYLGDDAKSKGIDFVVDLPEEALIIQGLEERLAQVFVNLISNALSFCEQGDAVRVWARKRANRVIIVVEDTGPGIPEEALEAIFQRFYSQRPDEFFGNNSGLGLAISKQIVEAHGGVIWSENVTPTQADITSEPLGARFVVGLPI